MYDGDRTPDLSNEFNPVPKVYKAKKPKKPLKQKGEKTQQWEDDRAELKEEFAQQGITTCELKLEGCWKNNALGFAHIDKRRNLTPQELRHGVVLACNPCHQKIEAMPHLEMRKMLVEIIQNRV